MNTLRKKSLVFKTISFAFGTIIISIWSFDFQMLSGQMGFYFVISALLGSMLIFTIGLSKYPRSVYNLKEFYKMFRDIGLWQALTFTTAIILGAIMFTTTKDPSGIPFMSENGEYFLQNHGKISEIGESAFTSIRTGIRLQLLVGAFMFYSFGQMILLKAD